jgi:hypothetical protein
MDILYRNIRIKTDGQVSPDVAQGKTATASSVEGANAVVRAVDGNSTTRWGSAYSDPQWITVDLGQPHALNRVRLNWETAYGRVYQIQVSPDNASWSTIYSTTAGDGGVDDLAVTGTGRYVRMNGTQRATQWGYSLWDFNVYGTPTGTQPTLLSQGRPTTASSVEPGSSHVAANAVDGNTSTRWGSAYSDPQWITVDLGSARTISRVRINWEAAYARAYQIQFSPNNTTWTNAHSTTTGDGGVDDVSVSGTARYVRINCTQRALTQYGHSLWELEIFGQ